MPGLSAPISLGARRCESWEDDGYDVRGDDKGSSEARSFKSAVTISSQPFEPTVFITWKFPSLAAWVLDGSFDTRRESCFEEVSLLL